MILTVASLLQRERFHFLPEEEKAFLLLFDREMERLGYTAGGHIGCGYCWGKYMLIYRKAGSESRKVFARVYLREDRSILRMYFDKVERHRVAIEGAPEHIQDAFTGAYGYCNHCHNQKADGRCSHRRSYRLHDEAYEFCDSFTFWFLEPTPDKVPDYIAIFTEFYPESPGEEGPKRRKRATRKRSMEAVERAV